MAQRTPNEPWKSRDIPVTDRHFHQRLWERYQIILKPGEYEKIRESVRDGSALLMRKERHRPTSLYYIVLKRPRDNPKQQRKKGDKKVGVFVVATNTLHLLMTVLPPEPHLQSVASRKIRWLYSQTLQQEEKRKVIESRSKFSFSVGLQEEEILPTQSSTKGMRQFLGETLDSAREWKPQTRDLATKHRSWRR